jgi:antitoxin ParD1/3/4
MQKNTSVTLGVHFDGFIAEQISRGRYASVSEAIREGLRLLEDREVRLAALQKAITDGLESGVDEEFSMAELQRELDRS